MYQLVLRLIAMCILASFVQCGPDTIGIRVHVIGVTADTYSLHVNTLLDGKPAMQGKEFTQQLNQFTIKVPNSAINGGHLTIYVAGLGIDHCRVSAGRRDIQLSKSNSYVELDVSLIPSKICTLLSGIAPSYGPTEGGISLQIDGQNFGEGASVMVDGIPATDVVVVGDGRLKALLPAKPGAFGRVPVVVDTPDGQRAVRCDLFAYYTSQLSFQGPAFSAGDKPLMAVVGDFNKDRKLDLVVANENSNNVSLLLGNGTGDFGAAANFSVGTQPSSVVLGDFNGDQNPDLAVSNRASNNVSVLLGNGVGGFTPAGPFPAGAGAYSVAVGDFNGDQKQDLAIANNGGNNVSILLGNGMGGGFRCKQLRRWG